MSVEESRSMDGSKPEGVSWLMGTNDPMLARTTDVRL